MQLPAPYKPELAYLKQRSFGRGTVLNRQGRNLARELELAKVQIEHQHQQIPAPKGFVSYKWHMPQARLPYPSNLCRFQCSWCP